VVSTSFQCALLQLDGANPDLTDECVPGKRIDAPNSVADLENPWTCRCITATHELFFCEDGHTCNPSGRSKATACMSEATPTGPPGIDDALYVRKTIQGQIRQAAGI